MLQSQLSQLQNKVQNQINMELAAVLKQEAAKNEDSNPVNNPSSIVINKQPVESQSLISEQNCRIIHEIIGL
jgi:hypothetical protein